MPELHAVMPLGSLRSVLIKVCTKEFIQILIDEIDLPVIVDAGIGRPSQACEAWRWELPQLWQIPQLQQPEMSRRWQKHLRKPLKQEEVHICQDCGRVLERGASADSDPLTGFLRADSVLGEIMASWKINFLLTPISIKAKLHWSEKT